MNLYEAIEKSSELELKIAELNRTLFHSKEYKNLDFESYMSKLIEHLNNKRKLDKDIDFIKSSNDIYITETGTNKDEGSEEIPVSVHELDLIIKDNQLILNILKSALNSYLRGEIANNGDLEERISIISSRLEYLVDWKRKAYQKIIVRETE